MGGGVDGCAVGGDVGGGSGVGGDAVVVNDGDGGDVRENGVDAVGGGSG